MASTDGKATGGQIGHISVRELYEQRSSGGKPYIIDVRTKEEYQKVHIPGVSLMPLDELTVEAVQAAMPKGEAVYVVCQSGHRSMVASRLLAKAGIDAVNVDGGTMAWAQAGLPVEQQPGSLRISK